ncbi:DUF1488 domain-containing protein [Erwinia billingiae]|uniref:DUF1488 domain-containing protein n=1 Tax=Erwinia billingiae TaxID=182337 RepID=UPI0012467717|nr:DUF1488 domain-containing protein [Erwinia billingiae]QEW30586.1 DUF1488 domain-containing protein [Erwinia billingiae]
MNQAIQFPDREWWDETEKAVCFPALVNGFLLTCAISGETMVRRYGNELAIVPCFLAHRLDLEDEAEASIKDAQENDQGWVWLS